MQITVKPGTTINNKTGAWRSSKPKFLHNECSACGVCARICPECAIYQTGSVNSTGKTYYDCNYDYCKGCGLCALECKFQAIIMEQEKKI